MTRQLARIHSLADFEAAARSHLPRPLFHYVCEAVEDNRSLADNRDAFAEWGFVPTALVDVTRRSAATRLFGHEHAQPFGIAPMGLCSLTAYRGDDALASAAAKAGIPMVLSGASLTPMEQVVRVNPAAWFQAYLPGEESQIATMAERADRAGFRTLVFTVDNRVGSNRENMLRAGFTAPLVPSARLAWDGLVRPRWLLGTFLRTLVQHGMPHFENNFATRGAAIISRNVQHQVRPRDNLSWQHIEITRRLWKGTLVIKGLLNPADARKAKELGADGVILSNHGGRLLDGAVSPLRVLPEARAAVGDLPLMIDGGIRRGNDILKALALGADFVFVGRPFNYAASVAGEAGVLHAVRLLAREILTGMGMLGVNRLDELTPAALMRLGPAR